MDIFFNFLFYFWHNWGIKVGKWGVVNGKCGGMGGSDKIVEERGGAGREGG